MTTGETVRALREARGWTVYRLAKATGMDQSQLSRVERGERTMTVETARGFCAALGVSMAVFDAAGD